MKHFYLFRHGETNYNVKGILQGQGIDSELNDNGKEQADVLGQSLSNIKLDLIISSPLKRALQTAAIVNKYQNVDVLLEPLLKEGCFGIVEGQHAGLMKKKFPKKYKEFFSKNREYMQSAFDKGESKKEIQQRGFDGLHKLLKNNAENIGIATHSMMMKSIMLYFYDEVESIANGEVVHLIYDGENFKHIKD